MSTTTDNEMKLGSEEIAKQVSEFSTEQIFDRKFPAGFEVIGSSGKVAILAPDGVVYKRTPYNDAYSLEVEAKHFQILRDRGYSWAPAFHYYEEYNIVAMKRYTVKDTRPKRNNAKTWEEMRNVIVDAGTRNIGYDENDKLFLIDGGGRIY